MRRAKLCVFVILIAVETSPRDTKPFRESHFAEVSGVHAVD